MNGSSTTVHAKDYVYFPDPSRNYDQTCAKVQRTEHGHALVKIRHKERTWIALSQVVRLPPDEPLGYAGVRNLSDSDDSDLASSDGPEPGCPPTPTPSEAAASDTLSDDGLDNAVPIGNPDAVRASDSETDDEVYLGPSVARPRSPPPAPTSPSATIEPTNTEAIQEVDDRAAEKPWYDATYHMRAEIIQRLKPTGLPLPQACNMENLKWRVLPLDDALLEPVKYEVNYDRLERFVKKHIQCTEDTTDTTEHLFMMGTTEVDFWKNLETLLRFIKEQAANPEGPGFFRFILTKHVFLINTDQIEPAQKPCLKAFLDRAIQLMVRFAEAVDLDA